MILKISHEKKQSVENLNGPENLESSEIYTIPEIITRTSSQEDILHSMVVRELSLTRRSSFIANEENYKRTRTKIHEDLVKIYDSAIVTNNCSRYSFFCCFRKQKIHDIY